MTNLAKTVAKIIKQRPSKYFKVMPYLLLTTKCENTFRDLLGIQLHKSFKPIAATQQRYEAALEHTFIWKRKRKRVDLAVFPHNKGGEFRRPVGIVEIKYLAKPKKACEHLEGLVKDLGKAKGVIRSKAVCYVGIFLVREAKEKYPGSSRPYAAILKKYPPLDELQPQQLDLIYKQLRKLGRTWGLKEIATISCGTDMGCLVKIRCFVLEL